MSLRTILLGVALLASCAVAWYWKPLRPWIHTRLRMLMQQDLPFPSYPAPPPAEQWQAMTAEDRLASARSRVLPHLHQELAVLGLELGADAFIRVFKESSELELWLRAGKDDRWKRFRTYPVACFSGGLGPKMREGDMQAPEGFYSVTRQQLNPASSYHLSFNIGYPNLYDRQHQRTGSLIMVHGGVCSVGCFAMTDAVIEEIYLVVSAALKADDSIVPLHVFPFRMTGDRMRQAQNDASPHLAFWRELQPAYDTFEACGKPPAVAAADGRYTVLP